MKTSLSYLPQIKQEQILQVVDIIKEVAKPEKIVLFGSYATGKYVEDTYIEDGVRYEYISDYDFLIVSKTEDEKEFVIKDRIVNRTRNLFKTPVNTIIHSLEYVNEGLEIGQYFFTDIVNDGILVFESNDTPFSNPRQLSDVEKKQIAQRYFDTWFNSGKALFKTVKFNFDEGEYNLAAFLLHQTAERFYNTMLLVFTGYKPKTHNLDILRQYTKPLSKDVFAVFPYPSNDKEEDHLFDLLKKGYIDARYKDDYVITKEELEKLIQKINRLQNVVQMNCDTKIKSFDI
jgi:HEPN domain-containing protein/predicted nucleotidyltransferase